MLTTAGAACRAAERRVSVWVLGTGLSLGGASTTVTLFRSGLERLSHCGCMAAITK